MATAALSKTCSKCGRTLKENNFYQLRDGTKTEMCKNCMTMHVDAYNPETFFWILQTLDVPYIANEWNILRDRAAEKDPSKLNGTSVLGKYVGKMRLSQWKNYRWSDTDRLALEQQEKEKKEQEEAIKRMNELKEALEKGDITQKEYDSYVTAEELQKEKKNAVAEPPRRDPVSGKSLEEEQDKKAFEEADAAILKELTSEDKIMLAQKWGKLYTPQEWVALEKNYIEMTQSFNIKDQDTKNTLVLLCKTNLKMNQMIDQGDCEGAARFSRMYDALRKSANFTAVQNKEDKVDTFSAIGELVAYCEKMGGAIPRYEIDTPLDIVDKVLQDMQSYTENLIKQDTSLAQQIETYLQQRKRMDEFKMKKLLTEKGLNDDDELTTEDYIAFMEQQEEDKKHDALALENGEESEAE